MARGRKKKTSYSGAELIQEYQKIYKVAEAKKRARGEEMQRSQFTMQKALEITFNALKKNYEEKGEHRTKQQLLKEIVSKQAYNLTQEQGRSIKKFLQLQGEPIKVSDARNQRLTKQRWDLIREQYDQLHIYSGFTSKEAHESIAQQIFGS